MFIFQKILKVSAHICLFFALISTYHFANASERVELEKSRYEQKYSRVKMAAERVDMGKVRGRGGMQKASRIVPLIPPFRASSVAVESDMYADFAIKYPNALARYKSLEEFSYFGFLKHDVETGRLDFETFLKEYENFLTQ